MIDIELCQRRMSVVEQEVEGEKLVTRHVLEQTRRNSDDLASIKAHLNRHDERFDRIEGRIGRMEGRLDRVETELRGLRTDLPRLVADTLREVLDERGR